MVWTVAICFSTLKVSECSRLANVVVNVFKYYSQVGMCKAFTRWAAELNACFVTHNKLAECASAFAFAFNVVNNRSLLVAEVFKLLQVVRTLAFVYFVKTNDRAFIAASKVSVVYITSFVERVNR